MDTTTAEQLSRYLDGDLDAAEAGLFEVRLASEPALAEELEALRRLRGQIAQVAERMEPPTDLDAALLPLGQRPPASVHRLPPAVRWLGMAAGVALAVTVAVEVARNAPERGPAPAPPSQATPAPRAPEAIERRAPARQPPAQADQQAAVEPEGVAGGADADERVAPRSDDIRRRDMNKSPAAETEERAATAGVEPKRQLGETANEVPQPAAKAAAPLSGAAPSAAAREEALLVQERRPADAAVAAPVTVPRLVLRGVDGGVVAELELPNGVPPGIGSPLVVAVSGGLISGIETTDGSTVRALERLAGRPVPDLPDGRYRADVEAAAEPP